MLIPNYLIKTKKINTIIYFSEQFRVQKAIKIKMTHPDLYSREYI